MPLNYDYIISRYDKIKMYTMDASSDLRFKNAIILEQDQAFNFLKPLNQQLKQGNLFFCDFNSNEVFLENVLPSYHWIHNIKEKELISNETSKKADR